MAFAILKHEAHSLRPLILRSITFLVGDLTLRGSMGMHPVAVHHLILYGKLGVYVPFPGESDHCLLKFFLEAHDQNYFDMLYKDMLYTPA